MGLGTLRLPCWDSRRVQSVPKAESVSGAVLLKDRSILPSDEPSHNEVGQRVGGTLQDGADDHDGRSEEDGLPASEYVTKLDTCAGADETSQIISSHGDACKGVR